MPANAFDLTRALLAGNTSAGQRVSIALPENPTFPAITYDLAGGNRNSLDLRRGEPRVRVSCWGGQGMAGDKQAYALALEVEEVLMPPSRRVAGFSGDITLDGGEVYVWNVLQESAPTPFPQETGYARYDSLYRIINYSVEDLA